MNLELFLAKRLLKGDSENSISIPIVRVAVIGIAMGICVILLAVFIISGFKREITRKVSGFTSHINILPYPSSFEESHGVVMESDSLVRLIKEIDGVKEAYSYIEKPAILRSRGQEIHGVLLKGYDHNFNPQFYIENLKAGEWPDYASESVSNDIVISASVANLLKIGTGERITAYFVQDPPRYRSFSVKVIYDTGVKEFDDVVVLVDKRHLARLNGWEADDASGIAIELDRLEDGEIVQSQISDVLIDAGFSGEIFNLRDIAPQIFDWLNLLNMNVWVLVILIIVVAGFNMVSGLMILILDKTNLIGLLKAFGYRNISIRKLFLYISSGLIIKGMGWGNVVALLLAGMQYYFHIIKLDPISYLMDCVPIYINLLHILLLNAGVIVATVLMMVIPTMLISRIDPIKSITFE